MAYIYRYRDNVDGIIKYVGIVYGENRTLENRIKEHLYNEEWCNTNFTIEYITENIDSRSEAEAFESHYISLYGTDKYFNKTKLGWGINKYLPDREKDFSVYLLPLNNVETKELYEVYEYTAKRINVYEDGDIYVCIDRKRKHNINKSDIEKYDSNITYTFDKKKAYLLAKENALRIIKTTENNYKKKINELNKNLSNINIMLEQLK